jgi:hypothetical protein
VGVDYCRDSSSHFGVDFLRRDSLTLIGWFGVLFGVMIWSNRRRRRFSSPQVLEASGKQRAAIAARCCFALKDRNRKRLRSRAWTSSAPNMFVDGQSPLALEPDEDDA